MAEVRTKKEIVKKTVVKKPAPKAEGFAVIETGGKQYTVQAGETITVEKIKGPMTKGGYEVMKVGDKVDFDKVLLTETQIGAPYVAGAKVSGTIASIGRNAKITVIKYKQKSRYFKKNGHRQPFFKITIDSIA